MRNLSAIGRIFYGTAIAGIGLQAICYHDLPYILSLPKHFPTPVLAGLAYIFGAIFALSGLCIVFEKKAMQVAMLFGGLLLLIFCFYYIPYELLADPNYMHFEQWENAEKELALAGGAFVIAGCFLEKSLSKRPVFLGKLIRFGAIFYSITLISFGTLHFLEAKPASTLIPAWIPNHIFWIYFAGVALIGSGIAIILKIKVRLIAGLLGLMIFLWFVILHIPRVIVAPAADIGDEITSAFLALAYSGIAFAISGNTNKKAIPYY